MRGWKFIDESNDDEDDDKESESEAADVDPRVQMKKKIRGEMIDKLVAEWNDYHQRIESRSFRCEEDIDNENDYFSERANEAGDGAKYEAEQKGLSPEEAQHAYDVAHNSVWAERDAHDNEQAMRLEVIEDLLGDLGVRMMRPYEHWNEEEGYMEYMENRYDDERERFY